MSTFEADSNEFFNTRHRNAAKEIANEEVKPRLGRRESEPHSFKINYIHDVLATNFPSDRTFWDLHHYFRIGSEKVDLQFDISFFKDFEFKDQVSSYNEEDHEMRRPTMVINILSRSTFNNDLGINAESCQILGIPVYVAFSDHLPEPEIIKAPFLKVFYKADEGYSMKMLRDWCCTEEDRTIDHTKTIDILPDILQFKFGIMKLKDRYWKKGVRHDLFQLVFIDRKTGEILPTRAEKAERQKLAAEKKAKKAQEQALAAEEKVRKLEKELEKMKDKSNKD